MVDTPALDHLADPTTDKADAEELRQYEHDMNQSTETEHETDAQRLLTPVELLTLAKMTFAKADLVVSDDGRFVIRGVEKRERDAEVRRVIPRLMILINRNVQELMQVKVTCFHSHLPNVSLDKTATS